MPKLNLIETIQTKLSTLTKKDGQLIVIRDNASLYIDLDGARIYISDWIDVATDEERLAMLSPLNNKYYYVVETNKIWRYISGSWILVTSKNYEDLQNKPKIEGVELSGNKTLSDFGGKKQVKISWADYQALSTEEQNNDSIVYYIHDYPNNISNILDSMEEIEANTQENQLAGALAVKEIAKYKMANTSGLDANERGLIVLNDWDLYKIGYTGMYYITHGTNIPSDVPTNGYLFALVYSNEFRQIMYMPYGTNRLFVNQMVSGAWVGWEEYAQNSELNKKASNLVYSVVVGETLTILNGELPSAYICATKGINGTAQSVIVGSGYGATAARHKITELISNTGITYTVHETLYGLSITNNSTGTISVGVTAII